LASDVLLLSGGVSAGVLDLVPQVLGELGVKQVFHKVSLKPGKPLWFGVHRPAGSQRETLVCGLPGNPVSGLVCFELFVRPAIQKLRGLPPTGLSSISAKLTCDHQQRGDRPTYWPAVVAAKEVAAVTPLKWQGSGDLRTLTDANALAIFPAGERLFRTGETITALLLPVF
jgi:molybdopterin molybdotransferase